MVQRKKKPETKLPKGFKCKCGKSHRFALYVYAHWNDELKFSCECGRVYRICCGEAEEE